MHTMNDGVQIGRWAHMMKTENANTLNHSVHVSLDRFGKCVVHVAYQCIPFVDGM
jgi:hypothetical protein